MNEIELKPCPFCGYDDINVTEQEDADSSCRWWLWCDRCGGSITASSMEKAAKMWNRRSDNEQRKAD